MTRNLKLAFFASLGLAATGCLGAYQAPDAPTATQDPVQATTPVVTGNTTTPAADTTPSAIPSPPTASSAKPKFESDVKPVLMAKCGQAACHGGAGSVPIKFVPTDAAQVYDVVLSFADKLVNSDFDKNKAQLLTKIAGGHNGATYSATEKSGIEGWLDAERAARAAGGTPTVSARAKLLAEWSGCMDLNDWNTDGVAAAWAQKQTGEGQCQQCHVNAQGWLADQQSQRVFDILTQEKNPKGGYFMEYYFTVDTTDAANPKMIVNTGLITRASQGIAQHPRFDPNTDNQNAMQKLQSFFTKTQARMTAKTCGASKLKP